MSEKERELLSTRSLVQEKELQLSQEADKASREICELQGKLLEKVRCCAPHSVLGRVLSIWGALPICCRCSHLDGTCSMGCWPLILQKGLLVMGSLCPGHVPTPPSHPTEQPGAEPAAEAAGRAVWHPARGSAGGRGHPPRRRGQAGRPPARPLHQLPRYALQPPLSLRQVTWHLRFPQASSPTTH